MKFIFFFFARGMSFANVEPGQEKGHSQHRAAGVSRHGARSFRVEQPKEIVENFQRPHRWICCRREGIVKNGAPYDTYWTNEISIPLTGKKVSMVVIWRNKYDPLHEGSHFYAPFEGHSSAANFKSLYASPNMIFSKKLPDMYTMAANTTVK